MNAWNFRLLVWVGVTDLIEHKIVTDTYLQQLYYGTLFFEIFLLFILTCTPTRPLKAKQNYCSKFKSMFFPAGDFYCYISKLKLF